MKSTGVIRDVDALGRIVIPKEIRKTFDINTKDHLEIYIEGDKIVLHKYAPSCVFCGSDVDVVGFNNKKVCKSCISELKKI